VPKISSGGVSRWPAGEALEGLAAGIETGQLLARLADEVVFAAPIGASRALRIRRKVPQALHHLVERRTNKGIGAVAHLVTVGLAVTVGVREERQSSPSSLLAVGQAIAVGVGQSGVTEHKIPRVVGTQDVEHLRTDLGRVR